MRTCKKCEEEMEVSEFEKGRYTCKTCRNKYHKEKRDSDPDKTRGYSVKAQYGITLEEYNKCMSKSKVCEICGTDKRLCYDHNHNTGEFRGVLCHWCNSALGDFKDNKKILLNAIKFLEDRGSYG